MLVYSCIFSLELEVACFDFAGGKRTFPNGMPFVQSRSSCLSPRDIVIGGGKRTLPNGMPTFSSIDAPQGSRDLVRCFLVASGYEASPLRIRLFLSS